MASPKPNSRHWTRRRTPRSARFVVLLVLGVGLVPLALGASVLQARARTNQRAVLDRSLAAEVTAQVAVLNSYFERARSVTLLTAQNQAFRDFYALPGTRVERIRAGGRILQQADQALAYLERLYPTNIGAADFIDLSGAENARVVRGRWAKPGDLSQDESANPFFAPAFALPPGQVYQGRPYVSPDTGEWVVSSSTLVPTGGRQKRAIVHFEVTVESFRKQAARNAHELLFVDGTTGQVIVDSLFPQRKGVPLGRPHDRRFVTLMRHGLPSGVIDLSGMRASYRRVARNFGNVNDWYVVALARPPGVSTLRGQLELFGGLGLLLLIVAVVMGRRWARLNRDFSALRRRSASESRGNAGRNGLEDPAPRVRERSS
jgi:hypothetical protein